MADRHIVALTARELEELEQLRKVLSTIKLAVESFDAAKRALDAVIGQANDG